MHQQDYPELSDYDHRYGYGYPSKGLSQMLGDTLQSMRQSIATIGGKSSVIISRISQGLFGLFSSEDVHTSPSPRQEN